MPRLLAIFIFFIVSLTGTAQQFTTINHNGVIRSYLYYTPIGWTSTEELPLLLVLHGLTQTGQGVADITNFNAIADQERFIAVYPNGLENAWNADMNVLVSDADDKGFLERLVVFFQQNFNTNPARTYLTGFSNGGFMSHKLACESNFCFAAIATVSGNMSNVVYDNCNPKFPNSVLHIHGTADAVVSYIGSPTTGVSVESSMNKWIDFLGCSSEPIKTNLPNPSILDLSTAEKWVYPSCQTGAELVHIRVNGGGHQWPGIDTWVGGVGTVNMDFYSPQVIWDFLKTKSCSLASLEEQKTDFIQIYPNPTQSNFTISGIKTPTHVSIVDLNGKMFFQEVIASDNKLIDAKFLPSGLYLVNFSDEQRTWTEKVIVLP